MKKKIFSKKENGAALLTTLMLILIITLIALSLNNTTTTDIVIAAGDKNYKTAFFNSDSGTGVSAGFLEAFFIQDFEGGDFPDASTFTYDANEFKKKILSKSTPEPDPDKNNETADIIFKADNLENQVKSFVTYKKTIRHFGSENSFQFLYNFESQGEGSGGTTANIKAGYRHIEHF